MQFYFWLGLTGGVFVWRIFLQFFWCQLLCMSINCLIRSCGASLGTQFQNSSLEYNPEHKCIWSRSMYLDPHVSEVSRIVRVFSLLKNEFLNCPLYNQTQPHRLCLALFFRNPKGSQGMGWLGSFRVRVGSRSELFCLIL